MSNVYDKTSQIIVIYNLRTPATRALLKSPQQVVILHKITKGAMYTQILFYTVLPKI